MSLRERFLKKAVPEPNTGCWLWIGAVTTNGYGQIRGDGAHGKRIGAHQVSWVLENGPIPDGLFVCHRCDVRACVNPGHLFLGTPQDNVDDMMRKGRHRALRGEDSPHAKLDNDQVSRIKARLNCGHVQGDVAKDFGVSAVTVSSINTGRKWAHVEAAP